MPVRQRMGRKRNKTAINPALIYALVTGSDFGFVFSPDDPRLLKPESIKRARRAWKQYGREIIRRVEAGEFDLDGFGRLPDNSRERLKENLVRLGIIDD